MSFFKKKRIAIAATQAPFIRGGAEMHGENLCAMINQRAGYQAEIVNMPYNGAPFDHMLDHGYLAKNLDISMAFGSPIDLMIGLKYPAWRMHHPRKRLWVLHQTRSVYDIWDRKTSQIRRHPQGIALREVIYHQDREAFNEAEMVFANSKNVKDRMARYNGFESAEVLYHPPPRAEVLRFDEIGDFFLFPSRVSGTKRHHLLLDAMAQTKSEAKVVIVGASDTPENAARFQNEIDHLALGDRLIWKNFVSDTEIIELYAKCRAVIFLPVDEDLGYVTLEAMLSAKPVLTATDSGGPLEFISDGVEGWVRAPDPQILAQTIDEIWGMSSHDLHDLGQAAKARYDALNISWDNVLDRLLEDF